MQPYSLYLHIPFCRHRCGYCDFNTYAGLHELIPDYTRALCIEIESASRSAGVRLPVHSIFFGGGTPSLLQPGELEQILLTLNRSFILLPGIEITLEANPGTIHPAYLRDIHSFGINRLSLGMQSANPSELHLLEREHSFLDVFQSLGWARQSGFTNLNLDLIFGLPDQELQSWQRTLNLALELKPEHFSLYALTLEHDTPFGHWAERGLISEPDPDQAAEMYEWAGERLEDEGYTQYEISNWALEQAGRSYQCLHNLQYWRNFSYLGFGAGAHGYAHGIRTENTLSPLIYIQRCLNIKPLDNQRLHFPITIATQSANVIDRKEEIGEMMMMGLRLTEEGVSNNRFQTRFGESLIEIFGEQIERLIGNGLVEWAGEEGGVLRLTRHGRLLGNQAFMDFL